MAKVIKEAQICSDCFDFLIGNIDQLEYHNISEEKIKDIEDKIDDWSHINLGNGLGTYGSIIIDGKYDIFSKNPCDVCGSKLAGQRYEIKLLGD